MRRAGRSSVRPAPDRPRSSGRSVSALPYGGAASAGQRSGPASAAYPPAPPALRRRTDRRAIDDSDPGQMRSYRTPYDNCLLFLNVIDTSKHLKRQEEIRRALLQDPEQVDGTIRRIARDKGGRDLETLERRMRAVIAEEREAA